MTVIGLDLGGTTVHSGRVDKGEIKDSFLMNICADQSEQDVLNDVYTAIDNVIQDGAKGIGVGVPGLVDAEKGIVFSLANIPSWQKVHLKENLEDRYGIPTYINNDANCFATGVKYFGQGKKFKNLIGLTLGTGMGAGLILNHRLYSGNNCGAGEYGMLPYKDQNYEYYCSGQYFIKLWGKSGKELHKRALDGDIEAINIFKEYGVELGKAIKVLLYTLDPEAVFLGGSVSKAFEYFKETMMREINTFEFGHILEKFLVIPNQTPDIALLGAAALYEDSQLT